MYPRNQRLRRTNHSYHSSEFDDCGENTRTISDWVWEESAHVSSGHKQMSG